MQFSVRLEDIKTALKWNIQYLIYFVMAGFLYKICWCFCCCCFRNFSTNDNKMSKRIAEIKTTETNIKNTSIRLKCWSVPWRKIKSVNQQQMGIQIELFNFTKPLTPFFLQQQKIHFIFSCFRFFSPFLFKRT